MYQLIEQIHRECTEKGITLLLSAQPTITTPNGFEVSGFWDDEAKVLACSVAHDGWIATLCHEHGHFSQWCENKYSGKEADTIFDDFDFWVTNTKELTAEQTSTYAKYIAECELDAEKRAVKTMIKWGIPFDVQKYIQKANAYVLFYEVARQTRKWCDRQSPHCVKKIVALCPTSWITDVSTLPEGYLDLVIKHCLDIPAQPATPTLVIAASEAA